MKNFRRIIWLLSVIILTASGSVCAAPAAVTISSDIITKGPFADVRAFLAKCNGVSDDTAAIVAAIASGKKAIVFPPGICRINSTVHINTKGIRFIGMNGATDSGTAILKFYGTGAAIELGTDSGNPYDQAEYNGTAQGFSMENMSLTYGGAATTALANAKGVYGTGTYGIKDWRGGCIELRNVQISKFEYGFWGVQSDEDTFSNCSLDYNKVGAHFGPRSDQFTANNCKSAFNDTALEFDSVYSQVLNHWVTNADGSPSTSPFKIYGDYPRSSAHIIFNDSWFENYDGTAGQVIPSFVSVGESAGANNEVRGVIFNNPFIASTVGSGTPRTENFISMNKSAATTIVRPVSRGNDNSIPVNYLVQYNSTANYSVSLMMGFHGKTIASLFNVTSSGVPQLRMTQESFGVGLDGAGGLSYNISPEVPTATGSESAQIKYFRSTGSPTVTGERLVTWYQGDGSSKQAVVIDAKRQNVKVYTANGTTLRHLLDGLGNAEFNKDGGGQNTGHPVFGGHHIWWGTSAPASGTWSAADRVFNSAPTVGQPKSWVCTVGGTPGTWVSEGNL